MKVSLFKTLRPIIDAAMTMFVIPAGWVMYGYRRIGSARLPMTTATLRRLGVFPLINHYYEPLFDPALLREPLSSVRTLPGIDFRLEEQLDTCKTLTRAGEFKAFVASEQQRSDETAFRLDNDSFVSGDADFLFQIIRQEKPGKIIEIGSGSSTKVAKHALTLNAAEGSSVAEHICVEPFEQPWLERLGGITVLRSKIEDCVIDWATALGPGDLLFIDSSHMIRPQGDVLYEYLTILPQLPAGVLVHVHDIFTPRDYLTRWVEQDVKFWNEQYILEAILGNSTRYEIVAALNLLKHAHFDALKAVCPTLSEAHEPGSFYFRVK
ncbi:class I SAM-dependent methyltransferase [Thalassobacter stenotrophicus]|uniref:class I SAM-dependent methyltransferase n=1 Tax=Thalassobacter stenotrophicus TaxID=266809 RepID=UPI0022A8FE0C|nr:class I SAM-dependent methyltransferase [Thalassobacter stenotrophicus]UYP67506.1 class I SAM-dependent methyltransferase [Thalassobacter stenotrophicus]